MTDTLTKLAYQTVQQGKSYFGFAHKVIGARVKTLVAPDADRPVEAIAPDAMRFLQQRLEDLNSRDWQDAEAGIYPASLLFDNPWADFFQFYPLLCLDMTKGWGRIAGRRYQEFSTEVATENYPAYYLQNFHNQTDGYLSSLSANLYDLQVEILFNGSADPMRRRILAPLKKGLNQFAEVRSPKILDVACGTGRSLRMMRGAMPNAVLYGTDLSPAYLRKANQLLSELPGELPQLIQSNAEELPYLDNYFHAVTSVFLFHELPPDVRQTIIHQCFRVLKPGGTLIICDSIQLCDSPELAPMMRNFPNVFHEPYYRSYTEDPIEERLSQAGFTEVKTEMQFMSKYWIARKPASA